jgi:hypothetical protein
MRRSECSSSSDLGVHDDRNPHLGYDLGKELARRMGVPYEPVIYQTPKLLVEDVNSGKWDVAFVAQDSEREQIMNFTGSTSASSMAISSRTAPPSRQATTWIAPGFGSGCQLEDR